MVWTSSKRWFVFRNETGGLLLFLRVRWKKPMIYARLFITIVMTYKNEIPAAIHWRWLTSGRTVKSKSDKGDSWLALNGGYTFVTHVLSPDIFPCWKYIRHKTRIRCHRRFRWSSTASLFHLHTEKDSKSSGKGERFNTISVLTVHYKMFDVYDNYSCRFSLVNGCLSLTSALSRFIKNRSR